MTETDSAARLLSRLRERGWRIAVAESCTGGDVLARLTAVPGASDAVWGGLVVYSAAAKSQLLGEDPDRLLREGLVSGPLTARLAAAVRQRAAVEIGLGVTGWAGPGSAGPDPVGTVYLGIAGPVRERLEKRRWTGGRDEVRRSAVDELIALALEEVEFR